VTTPGIVGIAGIEYFFSGRQRCRYLADRGKDPDPNQDGSLRILASFIMQYRCPASVQIK
jgi:hypothetical protein